MTITNSLMKIFLVGSLDVPTSKTVKVALGGYYIVMMVLKRHLKMNERVPLNLTIELPDKQCDLLELSVEVRDITGKPSHHYN